MKLELTAKGTVTDCREKLNALLAALPTPETQANKLARMIAHYIVADYLDPLHDEWQTHVQVIRAAKVTGGLGAGAKEPAEPQASFAIDCTVTFGGER